MRLLSRSLASASDCEQISEAHGSEDLAGAVRNLEPIAQIDRSAIANVIAHQAPRTIGRSLPRGGEVQEVVGFGVQGFQMVEDAEMIPGHGNKTVSMV
jgi:hypothetical protein